MSNQKPNIFAFGYFREQCGACLQCACSPNSHCKMVQKQDGANWRCGTGNAWKNWPCKRFAKLLASRFESLLKLKILTAKFLSTLTNIWRFCQLMLVDLLHKLLMNKWTPVIYNCLVKKYCWLFLECAIFRLAYITTIMTKFFV